MIFTHNPFEQTTAITDIFLGLTSLYVSKNLKNKKYWNTAFLLIAIASFIGAYIHGLEIYNEYDKFFWFPLLVCIFYAIALFWIATLKKFIKKYPKFLTEIIFILAGLFCFSSFFIKKFFLFFILYELGSFLILSFLYFIKKNYIIAFGMVISIVAGIIQTIKPLKFNFIWKFDHNGIFHLVQIIGILVLFYGLKIEKSKN